MNKKKKKTYNGSGVASPDVEFRRVVRQSIVSKDRNAGTIYYYAEASIEFGVLFVRLRQIEDRRDFAVRKIEKKKNFLK